MKNYTQIQILLVLLFIAGTSKADRTIVVPPQRLSSIAGGYTGATSYCVSAGIQSTNQVVNVPIEVNHNYRIMLTNSYSAAAQVRVTLTGGTSLFGRRSSGTSDQAYSPVGANYGEHTVVAGSEPYFDVTVPANSTALADITAACRPQEDCIFTGPGGVLFPVGHAPLSQNVGYNCVQVESHVFLRLKVTGNDGALVGSISKFVHRVNGVIDHVFTDLDSVAINGGRPF
jgi:hypothetical protein